MTLRLRSWIAPLAILIVGTAGFGVSTVTADDTYLLVGDVGTNTIKIFNTITKDYASGFANGVFASGGGLNTPFGLAFGDDNNLYVSSLGTQSILEYDGTHGTFIKNFVPSGTGSGTYPGGLSYPNQIAFYTPSGTTAAANLFVSSYSANGNGAVLEYAGPKAANAGTLLKVFSDPGLQGPTGLTFLNDQMYVVSSLNNRIYSFDPNGNGTGSLFATTTVAGQDYRHPAGLSLDNSSSPNIVAANFDGTTPTITRYAPPGSSTPGSLVESTSVPSGPVIALFGSTFGSYLVSSYSTNAIYRVGDSPSGSSTPLISGTDGNGKLMVDHPLYMTFFPQNVTPSPPGGGLPGGITPNRMGDNVVPVPEPTSFVLLGLGIAGVLAIGRRTARASFNAI